MSLLSPELGRTGPPIRALKAEASELVAGLKGGAIQLASATAQLVDRGVPAALEYRGRPLCARARNHAGGGPRAGLVGQGPFGYGWLGKWILANTEPPPKRKFKAPRSFTPPYDQPITAVLPTFLHLQGQLALQD
jgi:hypothetical protein